MPAASVLNEDSKGGSRFDRMALPGPFAILASRLRSRSGPLMAESAKSTKDVTATSSSYQKKTVQKEELGSG
jgi:hypothetical protein